MSFPIVVIERESGEVYLFRDIPHAEGYLEAIDVVNGEYDAFDSSGTVQRLGVATKSGHEEVEITRDPEASPVPGVLRARLKRYFDAMNEWRSEYDSMALPALVTSLVGRFAR